MSLQGDVLIQPHDNVSVCFNLRAFDEQVECLFRFNKSISYIETYFQQIFSKINELLKNIWHTSCNVFKNLIQKLQPKTMDLHKITNTFKVLLIFKKFIRDVRRIWASILKIVAAV